MRKISSILMTVLLGALCLTGCGSTDNNTAADRNVSSASVSSPAADAESNVALITKTAICFPVSIILRSR